MKMKDWMIRAIKTFVQAFFGILIPEICVLLNGGFPESWSKLWTVLGPVVAAALSAAICAVWNIILETMEGGEIQGRHQIDAGTAIGEVVSDSDTEKPDFEEILQEFKMH